MVIESQSTESQSTVAHLHVSEVKSQDTDTLTTHSESTRDVILIHAAPSDQQYN